MTIQYLGSLLAASSLGKRQLKRDRSIPTTSSRFFRQVLAATCARTDIFMPFFGTATVSLSENEEFAKERMIRHVRNNGGFIEMERRFEATRALADSRKTERETLTPRGPDASGTWISGPCAFGHRRLSVILIRKTGHSPCLYTMMRIYTP
ncbi:hypothetical protein VQ056_16835 [Paenibacillus sp. JTLBN-2024]